MSFIPYFIVVRWPDSMWGSWPVDSYDIWDWDRARWRRVWKLHTSASQISRTRVEGVAHNAEPSFQLMERGQ